MVVRPLNLSLRRQRQCQVDPYEFENSLVYIEFQAGQYYKVRSCLKKNVYNLEESNISCKKVKAHTNMCDSNLNTQRFLECWLTKDTTLCC